MVDAGRKWALDGGSRSLVRSRSYIRQGGDWCQGAATGCPPTGPAWLLPIGPSLTRGSRARLVVSRRSAHWPPGQSMADHFWVKPGIRSGLSGSEPDGGGLAAAQSASCLRPGVRVLPAEQTGKLWEGRFPCHRGCEATRSGPGPRIEV